MTARVNIPSRATPLLRAIGRLAMKRGAQGYVVGGCVRDWLLGLSRVTDLDITIAGDGVAVAQDVADILHGTLRVHRQFGTATVRLGARRIDIATCRRETYAKPAAYPRVSAGTLRDDLFRRDFTINAMAIAINPTVFGQLIDPFHGAVDLRRQTLRMLHGRSFVDDPSRILRGVRFASRFGFHWERQTHRALQAAVRTGLLGRLNAGRLRRELDRMLEEPDPRRCLLQLSALLDPIGG